MIGTLLPHTDAGITDSPYSAVLDRLGILHAGLIMNLVVVVAVLSCLNSGIYTASRMMFALAGNGEALRVPSCSTHAGVPLAAVLVAALAGPVTAGANYFVSMAAVFDFLVDPSRSMITLLYLSIAETQLRSRARARNEGRDLAVRVWGYPYLSWVLIVALVAVFALLAFPSTRRSLIHTLAVAAVAGTAGAARQRRKSRVAG